MKPIRIAGCACLPPQRGRRGLRNGPTLTLVLALVLGTMAPPLAARAQQPGKVFRIGTVGTGSPTDPEGGSPWGAFIQGLREVGYVEGQNITIEHRSSKGRYEPLPALAADLVRLKVDVIVAAPSAQRAAKEATRTIPMVMAGGDPVGSGFVASLAQPGGNITGVSSVAAPETVGKRLELLKEVIPRLSRVAVLGNPGNQAHAPALGEAKAAARSLGVQLQPLEAREPGDFEREFAAMTRERAGALLVLADGMFFAHRTRIAELAAKSRLPAMYGNREHVDAGGLMAYGASLRDAFRRAATYVDKILKGAKPGDLPVEQPTKFELVINLKTAKALGLKIPQSVLIRADEVIK